MALREKLRERSQPLLEQGEQIKAVFLAQTASQYLLVVPILFFLKNRYRVVAVTDRSVVVLAASRWMNSKPTGVLHRLPANTPLGSLSGMWGKLELGGEQLYVHKRFHNDVAEAQGLGGLATA